MRRDDPWDGILDPDEEILWHGAPNVRLRLDWETHNQPVFYTFHTGFSLVWMGLASKGGGVFWMFGLPFFAVGMYGLAGVHFWRAYQRRQNYYTLTSKRAFIATKLFGRRKLDSYPITPDTPVSLIERGGLGDIHFAERHRNTDDDSTTTPIGFEQLKDARHVMALIRQMKRPTPPPTDTGTP